MASRSGSHSSSGGNPDVKLYETLGVSKTATDSDIKAYQSKFTGLAKLLLFHPDENPLLGDKFKEISDAYAVLSDPSKRQVYDRFGLKGLQEIRGSGESPFGFGGDIFTDLSGGGRSESGGRKMQAAPPQQNYGGQPGQDEWRGGDRDRDFGRDRGGDVDFTGVRDGQRDFGRDREYGSGGGGREFGRDYGRQSDSYGPPSGRDFERRDRGGPGGGGGQRDRDDDSMFDNIRSEMQAAPPQQNYGGQPGKDEWRGGGGRDNRSDRGGDRGGDRDRNDRERPYEHRSSGREQRDLSPDFDLDQQQQQQSSSGAQEVNNNNDPRLDIPDTPPSKDWVAFDKKPDEGIKIKDLYWVNAVGRKTKWMCRFCERQAVYNNGEAKTMIGHLRPASGIHRAPFKICLPDNIYRVYKLIILNGKGGNPTYIQTPPGS